MKALLVAAAASFALAALAACNNDEPAPLEVDNSFENSAAD